MLFLWLLSVGVCGRIIPFAWLVSVWCGIVLLLFSVLLAFIVSFFAVSFIIRFTIIIYSPNFDYNLQSDLQILLSIINAMLKKSLDSNFFTTSLIKNQEF